MEGYSNKELTISLEKHYDKEIADLEKLMLSKFDDVKEAIVKADAYTKYRDEKQNEFRKALDDQSVTFSRKTELEAIEKQFQIWRDGISKLQEANFDVAMEKVRALDKELTTLRERKEGGASVWPWLITIISVLIAVGTVLYNLTI